MKRPAPIQIPVYLLTAQLENRLYWSEALFHPELSRLAARPPTPPLLSSLKLRLEKMDALGLYSRQPPATVEIERFQVDIPPAKRAQLWKDPFRLEFFAVIYPLKDLWCAHIPELNIEAITEDRAQLAKEVTREVRAELQRRKQIKPEALVSLQRWHSLQGEGRELEIQGKPPLPPGHEKEEEEESQLLKLTSRLHKSPLPAAFEVRAEVARLAELLGAETHQNVLLVGPAGAGKTALLYELARRRASHKLGATPFYETSGARLLFGEATFGGWQERCSKLIKELVDLNAILHLGHLQELLESARHSTNPYGIAGFLRPFLAGGKLRATVEATPEELAYVEREYPQFLEALVVQRIEAAPPPRTRAILERLFPSQGGEVHQAVVEVHERFSSLSAAPGWAVRFLRGVIRRHPREKLTSAHVLEHFSQQSGLPLLFFEDNLPFRRDQVLDWFTQRLHGQTTAVELVVDRLAAFKSGLTRPGRPVASFLLVGPTGVGKTELARCLAEFVFQDRQRLSRLDMSEYSDAASVLRLIGSSSPDEPGLLVGMVRDRPFQVVLFDELEKAHPNFFDLLLQILGDARLTDGSGRVADFSNSLILMTSNLGAESFQKGSLGLREQSREGGFLEAVRATFRPELINRIDEIIPFAPLSRETVLRICQQELRQLPQREGLRSRAVELAVTPAVVEFLADKGYDKLYGARPLKRALDAHLLGPLSAILNAHKEEVPLKIHIEVLASGKLSVLGYPQSTPEQASARGLMISRMSERISGLRRLYRRLQRGPLITDLRNDKIRHRRASTPFPGQEFLDKVDALGPRVQDLEEQALLALEDAEMFLALFGEDSPLVKEVDDLIVETFARAHEPVHRILLAFYGTKPETQIKFANAYLEIIQVRGYKVRVEVVSVRRGTVPLPTTKDPLPHLTRQELDLEVFAGRRAAHDDLGYLLEVRGPYCQPLLRGEGGLHEVTHRALKSKVIIEVSDLELTCDDKEFPHAPPAYQPPPEIHRRGSLPEMAPLRTYDFDNNLVLKDALVGSRVKRGHPGPQSKPAVWDPMLSPRASGLALAVEKFMCQRLYEIASEAALL